MPRSSGPYTPRAGVPFNISNPAASGGNLVTAEAIIVNLSPFELQISAAEGMVIALIDPFTRDGVPLDTTSQQLVVTPLSIGFTPPAGVAPTIYVLWYGPQERVPSALPAPVVPYGNLQQVSVVGGDVIDPNLGAAVPLVGTARCSCILNGPGSAVALGGVAGKAIYVFGWSFLIWSANRGSPFSAIAALTDPTGLLDGYLEADGSALGYATGRSDLTVRAGLGALISLYWLDSSNVSQLEAFFQWGLGP
jgi:hypothetical protein